MSRFMRLIVIVSMAAAAASCAAGGTTVLPLYVGSYDPGMLNYAASKGGMLTEIVGNPFDVPKEEVGRAVTNNMTGSHFGPKVVFTTKASPDNLSVANSYLRGDREFEKATAMLFPSKVAQRGRMRDHTAAPFRRRVTV